MSWIGWHIFNLETAIGLYQPLVDSSQFKRGDFAVGCDVEIDANLNKVSEIERSNPAAKDPCRNGKDQLEAGIEVVVPEFDRAYDITERDIINDLKTKNILIN